jgi:hypothetical protein
MSEAAEATATVEAPAEPPEDESIDYEIELNTPFGIVELEFEPRAKKERKDRERKERQAKKAAEKAALKAKREADKALRRGPPVLLILLIIAIVGVGIALAVWLFARPGEEEEDVPEYLLPAVDGAVPQPPQSFIERARTRIREAVRQGRQASRDAQREQQQRYRGMSNGE